MKSSSSILLTLGALISIASGCGEPTTPSPPEVVPPPPAPPPPAAPVEYANINGVYNLTASIKSFDPAWGDLTGYRYTAVLTLADGAGTYSDFRVLDSNGELLYPPGSGSVTRGVDATGKGRLILEIGSNFTVIIGSIAKPEGNGMGSPRVEGTFGAGGHISGEFVATRRTP